MLDAIQDLADLSLAYGPIVASVLVWLAFELWSNWQREQAREARITLLESEMRGVVLPLVKESTRAVTRNTVELRRLRKFLSRWE